MKSPYPIYSVLILLVLNTLPVRQSYSQSIDFTLQSIDSTLAKFERYHQQTPLEKAYLHTDKEVYTQGETLWFSAYLVDASSHIPSSLSTLLYADLINPENEAISTLSIKLEEGTGAGEFFLDDSLAEGTYTLRAYTNYMRNFDADYFFSKPIKLLKFNRDNIREDPSRSYPAIDFQLFPEGGQLINGMVNNVAFRIINEKGYGMDIAAKIVNDKGKETGQFTTQHLGMGVFRFYPKEGERYFAKYEMNGVSSSVQFPMAKSEGYQLSVRQNAAKTYVTVKATKGLSFNDCFVLAHVRGRVVSVFRAKPGIQFIYHVINNEQLPSGIIHFTVFKSGEPILERLAYIDNPSERPILTPTLKNKNLKRREKVYFDLNLKSADSLLLSANLSVSVLKAADEVNKIDIENFLLLTSDLKGTIEHPEYYTDRNNPDRLKSLDLLMLTHGWRKFSWQDILADSLPPISYYPEKGFTIEGQVVKYINRKKGRPTRVALSFLENMDFQQESETQPDGNFWFDGLQIEDTVTAIVRTLEMDQKKLKKKMEGKEVRDKGTYIVLHNKKSPVTSSNILEPFEEKERYRNYLDDALDVMQIAAAYDEKLIILEEIVVKGKRHVSNRPYQRQNMLYRNPDKRVIMDSIPGSERYTNIFQLIQGRVAGVTITGTYPNKSATIRGREALFLLDGSPVNGTLVNSIDPRTIEFIDVLTGLTTAAIYGTSNGVIALYTYQGPRGGLDPDRMGFQAFRHPGFYPAREFYVPKYDLMSADEKIRPDYRTTQYWNPKVKVSDGKASFNYYTSDNRGDFILYLEGITMDGKIVKDQLKFSVD